jgi:UDP-2,4-diacetamido-2,4,6-trideoxy-beta-L-altropyranose hydrolase
MPSLNKTIFLIEGGIKYGFGHFCRTSLIAQYLKANFQMEPVFIVGDEILANQLNKLKIKFYLIKFDEISSLNPTEITNILINENCNNLVIDVRSEHDPSLIIQSIKNLSKNIQISLIENATPARFLVDKNIYPVPKDLISNLIWQDYQGKVYAGLKYYPLKNEFIQAKNNKQKQNNITITMGGTDPNNLTLIVMQSLVGITQKINVIIGPTFKHKDQIKAFADNNKNMFNIYEWPKNYAAIIASSSLVFTALGTSIYEINYLDIPVVVVGNYENDSENAQMLGSRGYYKYLGYHQDVTLNQIKSAIDPEPIIKNQQEKATELGLKNISEIIINN